MQRTTGIADTVRMYGYLTQLINLYYCTYFSSDKVKSCKVCPSYDEFVKKCHDLEKITVSDVFALQLMKVVVFFPLMKKLHLLFTLLYH